MSWITAQYNRENCQITTQKRQLQVTGDDPGLLVVSGKLPTNSRTSAAMYTGNRHQFAQHSCPFASVDPAHGELQIGPRWTSLCLSLCFILPRLLSSTRHDYNFADFKQICSRRWTSFLWEAPSCEPFAPNQTKRSALQTARCVSGQPARWPDKNTSLRLFNQTINQSIDQSMHYR